MNPNILFSSCPYCQTDGFTVEHIFSCSRMQPLRSSLNVSSSISQSLENNSDFHLSPPNSISLSYLTKQLQLAGKLMVIKIIITYVRKYNGTLSLSCIMIAGSIPVHITQKCVRAPESVNRLTTDAAHRCRYMTAACMIVCE